MIRANVYSVYGLPRYQERSLRTGLELVGQHIGQKIVSETLKIRTLPINSRGNIIPGSVGYRKLDKNVELHVFTVPLDPGEDETVGIAYMGTGVSYVDSRRATSKMIEVTAHEVAHSLGFVVSGALQEDPFSENHCVNRICIMHRHIVMPNGVSAKIVDAALKAAGEPVPAERGFCNDCKEDMRRLSATHLADMMTDRLIVRQRI
jgi:hypothetical protein